MKLAEYRAQEVYKVLSGGCLVPFKDQGPAMRKQCMDIADACAKVDHDYLLARLKELKAAPKQVYDGDDHESAMQIAQQVETRACARLLVGEEPYS